MFLAPVDDRVLAQVQLGRALARVAEFGEVGAHLRACDLVHALMRPLLPKLAGVATGPLGGGSGVAVTPPCPALDIVGEQRPVVVRRSTGGPPTSTARSSIARSRASAQSSASVNRSKRLALARTGDRAARDSTEPARRECFGLLCHWRGLSLRSARAPTNARDRRTARGGCRTVCGSCGDLASPRARTGPSSYPANTPVTCGNRLLGELA